MTALELVAMAARTPVGLTPETSAAAVRAGISRLREFEFCGERGQPMVLGADLRLDPRVEGRARMWAMLESVLVQLSWVTGGRIAGHGCFVLLALPEARPGFSDDDAQWLCQMTQAYLHARGVASRPVIAARGHAGALAAVHQAAQWVALRAVEPDQAVFLVAGVDSYIHPDTLMWLEADQRLALEGNPNGFTPGEAAAGLILTTALVRAAWGLPAKALVRGTGIARESLLRTSETGSFGVALHEAVAAAGSGLALPDEAADSVYYDANGERYRSEEWAFFVMRGHQRLRTLDYLSPCDCWGDVGAAFGPLGLILAAQAFERGYAPGPRALILAGSEAGLRGAVVLQSVRRDSHTGERARQ